MHTLSTTMLRSNPSLGPSGLTGSLLRIGLALRLLAAEVVFEFVDDFNRWGMRRTITVI